MRIHKKTEIPTQVKNEHFTVDVITCDKDGLINLGFYNFDFKKMDISYRYSYRL